MCGKDRSSEDRGVSRHGIDEKTLRHYLWCQTSSPQRVQAAVDVLATRQANLRCEEIIALLEGLGLVVRDGKKQGQKIVTHPGLDDLTSASLSFGHGRNPSFKAAYTVILEWVVTTPADALRVYLTR